MECMKLYDEYADIELDVLMCNSDEQMSGAKARIERLLSNIHADILHEDKKYTEIQHPKSERIKSMVVLRDVVLSLHTILCVRKLYNWRVHGTN